MKKLFLIINPNDVKESHKRLSTLEGTFILPNVYKIKVADEDIESAINGLEHLLIDIDFHAIINDVFSN